MVELQYRRPNEVKQDYAPRISQQQWQCHEGTVRYLHKQEMTRKEIIDYLLKAYGFRPTLAQLNAQMRRWELRVYGTLDPAPRGDIGVMPLCELPRQEALSMSEALCPMDTAEDCVDPMPEIVLRDSNLGIDQNTFSVPQNGDNRVERTTEIVHEFHQQLDVAISLVEEPSQAVPEISMITFTPESPQPMGVCGRSSSSHCTRSTFATHASDTSSLRDFRATAARAYHASVSRPSFHPYRRLHIEDLVKLLNSWVFIMADAEMLREVYGKLYKAAAMTGRYSSGCICKPELPRLTRLLQGSNQQYLEGLMEDLSRLQAQGFFPADKGHMSSRGRGHSNEQSHLGDCTPCPVVEKFDAFVAQMGCPYCLMEKLNRWTAFCTIKWADPDCLECKVGIADIPRRRITSWELATTFKMFCMEIQPEPIIRFLEYPFGATKHLQRLHEHVLESRARLLRSYQQYEYSKSQAELKPRPNFGKAADQHECISNAH